MWTWRTVVDALHRSLDIQLFSSAFSSFWLLTSQNQGSKGWKGVLEALGFGSIELQPVRVEPNPGSWVGIQVQLRLELGFEPGLNQLRNLDRVVVLPPGEGLFEFKFNPTVADQPRL